MTALARAHGRLDLLGLTVDELARRFLKLALIGEVGHIGRMLADDAQLAGHLALIAAERRVLLVSLEGLEVLRVQHYSIRTERCYCDWIRRYVLSKSSILPMR